MIKYFVWGPSMLGVKPAIWYDKQTDGAGKAKPTVGTPIELPDSDKRSISQLEKDYPCGL